MIMKLLNRSSSADDEDANTSTSTLSELAFPFQSPWEPANYSLLEVCSALFVNVQSLHASVANQD